VAEPPPPNVKDTALIPNRVAEVPKVPLPIFVKVVEPDGVP
jgi:hypothetical protein